MQQELSILQPILDEQKVRRKELRPAWIKVFTWFFMIAGALTPLILIVSTVLPTARVQLGLYGFETNTALSPIGLFIVALFLLKGIVSFGLLTEKQRALSVAIADAIVGIAICAFSMFIIPLINPGAGFSFRLELVLLIPYLMKLQKIKPLWERK